MRVRVWAQVRQVRVSVQEVERAQVRVSVQVFQQQLVLASAQALVQL